MSLATLILMAGLDKHQHLLRNEDDHKEREEKEYGMVFERQYEGNQQPGAQPQQQPRVQQGQSIPKIYGLFAILIVIIAYLIWLLIVSNVWLNPYEFLDAAKQYICDPAQEQHLVNYANLKQQLEQLKADNKTLSSSILKLLSNITDLESTNSQLETKNEELGKENTKLIKNSNTIDMQQLRSQMYVNQLIRIPI